jgi:hypothetical protein
VAAAADEEAVSALARAAALALACALACGAASAQADDTRALNASEKAGLDRQLKAFSKAEPLDLATLQSSTRRAAGAKAGPWRLQADVWSAPAADPAGFCHATHLVLGGGRNGGWAPARPDDATHEAWIDDAKHCAARPKDTLQYAPDLPAARVNMIARQPEALRKYVAYTPTAGCDGVMAHARLVRMDSPAKDGPDSITLHFREAARDAAARTVVARLRLGDRHFDLASTTCAMP